MSLQMENYIVSFIDILGASALIKEDKGDTLFRVHKAYESSLNIFKNGFKRIKKVPGTRIFSDNILIYCSVTKGNEEADLKKVLLFTGIFQYQLMKYDILTRGGIAEGVFFDDELMVWGTALVDAYALENQVALFPRVVMSETLARKYLMNTSSDLMLYVTSSDDGLRFVDFLSHLFIEDITEQNYLDFERNLNRRIDALSEHMDIRILQKYNWLKTYLQSKKELYLGSGYRV